MQFLCSVRRSVGLSLGLALALAACGPSSTGNGNGDGDGGGNNGVDAGPGGCQGAGCQNFCPNGTATMLTGVVLAPNGIDPVPGAVVYVPFGVNEFPPEVECEVCNQITDSAVVSTVTAPDGTFTLGPLPTAEMQPAGTTVPIVAQKGRFRKLVNFPIQVPCGPNSSVDGDFRLPSRNSGQFDRIPNIAVATGDYDIMECVLLKLGIDADAFTLYGGESFGGTPNVAGMFDALLMNAQKMKEYNVIFINCTGDTYENLLTNPTIRNNILDYVASGGRLYVTDWSYDYVEQIEAFSPLIDFGPGASGATPEPMNDAAIGDDGITTEALVSDPGMIAWLNAVEQRTGDQIIGADNRVHIEHFLVSWVMQYMVMPSTDYNTTVWLHGPVSGGGLSDDLPLTTTFDYQQCGRVLYSSYHTRGRDFGGLGGMSFPAYCPSGEPLSPQERVLEYLILHIADCIVVE